MWLVILLYKSNDLLLKKEVKYVFVIFYHKQLHKETIMVERHLYFIE